MRIKKSYTSGWSLNLETYQNSVILYLSNFFLALILGLIFINSFESDSLLFDKLFKNFNFTALVEMLRHFDSALPLIKSSFFVLTLAFILLRIFFTGGIIDSFFKEDFMHSRFWGSSIKFFSKFLRLTLYFFVFYTVIALISFVPLAFVFKALAQQSATEPAYITSFITAVFVFVFLSSFLFIISDYSKFIIYLTEPRYIFKSILRATKFVFKNLLKTYSLFLLLMIAPLILIAAYLVLNLIIGDSSIITLIISFLLAQVFIFSRIFIRIWIMSSQYQFYTYFFNKNIEYKKAEFYALDEKAETLSQLDFDKEKNEIRKNKEEKAKVVINDVNSILNKIQNQLNEIEKEARPELKEEMIEKLLETSKTEEWEMLEENAQDTGNSHKVSKVMSLIDEIKQERSEQQKENNNKLSDKIKGSTPKVKKDSDDIFEIDE